MIEWSGQKDGARAGVHALVMFRVDGFFVFVSVSFSFLQSMWGPGTGFGVKGRWCVLFGDGGEDVLIPFEVYLVYIGGPTIQKFGDGTDLWVGTTEERPRGRADTDNWVSP